VIEFKAPKSGRFLKQNCDVCGDSGTLSNDTPEGRFMVRCTCEKGQGIPMLYAPSDKDRTKPLEVPLPSGVSKPLQVGTVPPRLVDKVFEYLNPRLELMPLGRCENPITYFASEGLMYSGYCQWSRERKEPPMARVVFHSCVKSLFFGFMYWTRREEWKGFRFHAKPIEEREVVIYRNEIPDRVFYPVDHRTKASGESDG